MKIIHADGSNSGSVQQLWDRLLKDRVVISNSPKNRKRLFNLLQEAKLPFRTEVIGYTPGGKKLGRYWCRHAIPWDLGRIVKWISAKRIIADDICASCDNSYFPWEPVKAAFTDPDMPNTERYRIINTNWGEGLDMVKWTPFDNVLLRKTVVRIYLL